MQYKKLPKVMWLVFENSFKRELYRMSDESPKKIMKSAKERYKEILKMIPEFEKDDRFKMNILSAAMLASVYIELSIKPELKNVENFYHHAMTDNLVMRLFLKKKNNYTSKAQKKLKQGAIDSVERIKKNPYTWCYTYEKEGKNSYSAIFTACGIKHLFETLDISEITPAMCTYDYDMAELAGSIFTRKNTLASGGDCCDCHYKKKEGN